MPLTAQTGMGASVGQWTGQEHSPLNTSTGPVAGMLPPTQEDISRERPMDDNQDRGSISKMIENFES